MSTVTTKEFEKTVRVGLVDVGSSRLADLFCKISYKDKGYGKFCLSICGVEGPKANGNALGGCGQITDSVREVQTFAAGWNAETAKRFADVWDAWHLNDMRAGCVHQRADWDTSEKLEVVEYMLTGEARELRKAAQAECVAAALEGRHPELSPIARALLPLKPYDTVYTPPDADSVLSGCYEVYKRETKAAGWVYEKEHARGLLCKPCPVCGYKYGTAHLFEEVPEDVLAFLRGLPDADKTTAWV